MKKKILILVLVLLCLLVFVMFLVSRSNNDTVKGDFPNDKEPYKKIKTIKNNMGGKGSIELKYDQYIVATGYMGASDNIYYTRNHSLYHLQISINETTKLAEGVDSIKGDMEKAIVKKGKKFRIIKEDEYIEYVD